MARGCGWAAHASNWSMPQGERTAKLAQLAHLVEAPGVGHVVNDDCPIAARERGRSCARDGRARYSPVATTGEGVDAALKEKRIINILPCRKPAHNVSLAPRTRGPCVCLGA